MQRLRRINSFSSVHRIELTSITLLQNDAHLAAEGRPSAAFFWARYRRRPRLVNVTRCATLFGLWHGLGVNPRTRPHDHSDAWRFRARLPPSRKWQPSPADADSLWRERDREPDWPHQSRDVNAVALAVLSVERSPIRSGFSHLVLQGSRWPWRQPPTAAEFPAFCGVVSLFTPTQSGPPPSPPCR